MVSLLAPLVYGVYLKSPCARGAIASMLSGTLVWLVHAILGWESFFNLSELLPVGLNCTALSFVAYWVSDIDEIENETNYKTKAHDTWRDAI